MQKQHKFNTYIVDNTQGENSLEWDLRQTKDNDVMKKTTATTINTSSFSKVIKWAHLNMYICEFACYNEKEREKMPLGWMSSKTIVYRFVSIDLISDFYGCRWKIRSNINGSSLSLSISIWMANKLKQRETVRCQTIYLILIVCMCFFLTWAYAVRFRCRYRT